MLPGRPDLEVGGSRYYECDSLIRSVAGTLPCRNFLHVVRDTDLVGEWLLFREPARPIRIIESDRLVTEEIFREVIRNARARVELQPAQNATGLRLRRAGRGNCQGYANRMRPQTITKLGAQDRRHSELRWVVAVRAPYQRKSQRCPRDEVKVSRQILGRLRWPRLWGGVLERIGGPLPPNAPHELHGPNPEDRWATVVTGLAPTVCTAVAPPLLPKRFAVGRPKIVGQGRREGI